MGIIITDNHYLNIRSKLVSDNNKLIKLGIQQLLENFEHRIYFEKYDVLQKKDFNAIVHTILRNSDDEDVRKWLYHLLCLYKPNIEDKDKIKLFCLNNIEKENKENISWIVALIAAYATDQNSFACTMDSSDIKGILTRSQLDICASTYREDPFCFLENRQISKLVDSEDNISQIWLTKIFANNINWPSNKYQKNHSAVTEDVICSLFYNSDETVQKYSVWAFAQGGTSYFEKLYAKTNFSNLNPGQQKWYFTCLFSDEDYIANEPDHAKEILKKELFSYPDNIREGIINGLTKSKYSPLLSQNICEWFESDEEENETIQLLLLEYLIKHFNQNTDFQDILNRVKCNVESLPTPLKNAIILFEKRINEKEGTRMNSVTIEKNFGLVITGNHNSVSQSFGNSDIEAITKCIDLLKSSLKNEDKCFLDETELEDIKNSLTYLTNTCDILNESFIAEMTSLREQIQSINVRENKCYIERILNALLKLTNLCKAEEKADSIVELVKNILATLRKFIP